MSNRTCSRCPAFIWAADSLATGLCHGCRSPAPEQRIDTPRATPVNAADLAALAELLAWRSRPGLRWQLTVTESIDEVTLELHDVGAGKHVWGGPRPTVHEAIRDAMAAWAATAKPRKKTP